ncbi:hypothetical protein M2480_000250 [Parabacteroides sp. PFB2-12]|uniref:DUF3256 family protein n=1 Tax=unclassified Parabacteroides TaxID=2649774 RepID=UPI002472EDD3|nr:MULTISPECIES: DUF3256 family protein [unclassified Parabacteroides]MDH6341498.1 hypothetical protein [Parabacteroides sp. PM6-13]MDH6389292.1 hypothetical protein [Parabacteroides sp. PFB2-12]
MRLYIVSLLLFLSSMGVYAQNMATLFTDMPDSYIPQLETAWRKDLVNLYQTEKEARVQNLMGGFTVLKALTSDYMLLQVSERSTVEIKLFPLVNNTPIICLVTTVYGPAPDSRVDFYSPDWSPLDANELFTPTPAAWFLKEEIAEADQFAYNEALSLLDIELIHYQLHPDSLTLTATYATPLYLSQEEREKVMPFIKEEPKVYAWKKFHLQ